MAPRVPIALREIQYSLSPYQQDIVKQAIRNAPHAVSTFFKEVRRAAWPPAAAPVLPPQCNAPATCPAAGHPHRRPAAARRADRSR